MDPKQTPRNEVVAATDEIFERQSAIPVEPAGLLPPEPAPAQPAVVEEVPTPDHDDPRRPRAHLSDYTRELQQEYDREQEKGKLDLFGPGSDG